MVVKRLSRSCQVWRLSGGCRAKVTTIFKPFSMHANSSKGGERFLELVRNTHDERQQAPGAGGLTDDTVEEGGESPQRKKLRRSAPD